MESALDLRHHRPGTLPQLAPYLHERTAGRIGSRAGLIRQAAITALIDGTERIAKTTLEAIRLDHLAEQHHQPAPGPGDGIPAPVSRTGVAARTAVAIAPAQRGVLTTEAWLRTPSAAPGMLHTPLTGEATDSYAQRLANTYQLTLAQLLDGAGITLHGHDTLPADELHLNRNGPGHLTVLARTPLPHLTRALPRLAANDDAHSTPRYGQAHGCCRQRLLSGCRVFGRMHWQRRSARAANTHLVHQSHEADLDALHGTVYFMMHGVRSEERARELAAALHAALYGDLDPLARAVPPAS
ncbi:hypothetical protein [Streptomyces sp. NPDC001135]